MLPTFMEVWTPRCLRCSSIHRGLTFGLTDRSDVGCWTSYLVANAIVAARPRTGLQCGIGRKRFFIICVAIFTGIVVRVRGCAPRLASFWWRRILQGAGGGALQPLSQSILLESFPPEKRGVAMAGVWFGVVCAPSFGPTLGDGLPDAYSWRYAFYIKYPGRHPGYAYDRPICQRPAEHAEDRSRLASMVSAWAR